MDHLHRNTAENHYELQIDGQTVFADCRLAATTLSIFHLEAPPALRGTGAAGRLMAALVAEARAQNWKINPTCGYAAAWLTRHPEHHDLHV